MNSSALEPTLPTRHPPAFEQKREPQVTASLELAAISHSPSDPDAALALIDRVTSELAAADRRLLLQLEDDLTSIAGACLPRRASTDDLLERLGQQLSGDSSAGRRLLAMLAFRKTRMVAPARLAAELAERALAGGRLLADGVGSPPLFAVGTVLGLAGRAEAAEQLFSDVAALAELSDSPAVLCGACGQRGVERYRRGALPQARQDLERALDIARGELWESIVDDRRAHLLRVHVERGACDVAERMLESWGATGPLPETAVGNQLLVERGRLRLNQGRARAALPDLRCAEQRLATPGDSLLFEWRIPAALAHHRLGYQTAAVRLAREELEVATAWGAPRQLGAATATLGLIEGGERGLELLRDAVEILRASPARLEHARASIDLGAALRRARRPGEARGHLRTGLELAVRCGSPWLADIAHHELAATGIKRRRRTLLSGPDALTPTEQRVALQAADGLSNPEIARALYVTRKTVEMHLGNVYRKLGIHSREDLGSVLDLAA
jgi:DNA-binding CsgD family transcriptional regulator